MRLFSLIFFLSVNAFANSGPSSVFSNEKGVDEIKKSNPGAAQEKFLKALSSNPFEARLHLNLGLSFELLNQPDKAQSAYETARQLAKDDETRFVAAYNLGELAQKSKQKDKALSFYQEALKYNPDSVETKTNIELLTQDQKGEGEGKDSKDQQDQKDPNKDQKNQGKDSKDQKEDQNKEDKPKEGDQKKDDKPKEYGKNKPQPRKFKSEELSQGDVNKILGEIKQQEQKIRAEFNKKEVKDQPRDKDW